MISEVVHTGMLYTACFPHTVIFGRGTVFVRGERTRVTKFALE